MSIFTRIKDAIFGQDRTQSTAPKAPARETTARGIPASPADAQWEPVRNEQVVDVEAVLEARGPGPVAARVRQKPCSRTRSGV